jgi:hypothetical protein
LSEHFTQQRRILVIVARHSFDGHDILHRNNFFRS